MSTPVIILVRPQMGENIGAVARAMANFGLSELRLVAPRDGWPNERARDMATHGLGIVDAASVYSDVASALADLHWVAASSARGRDMAKPVLVPDAMAKEFASQEGASHKVGLMFGPERSGLENEDLALADALVTIPTAAENSSLNIAQAMVVLGYSCFLQQKSAGNVQNDAHTPAQKEEMHQFFRVLEEKLDATGHWRVLEKKERMWLNLRALFTRAQPSATELQSLLGMVRSLGKAK
jgi:tRNA/rRNA methyltransferase